MKKRIIQIRDHPTYTTVASEAGSNVGEICYYKLIFEDGSSVIAGSKECDGQILRVGDEIFIYAEINIISRKALSSQDIKKIIRYRRMGYVLAVIIGLLAGIAAAVW